MNCRAGRCGHPPIVIDSVVIPVQSAERPPG